MKSKMKRNWKWMLAGASLLATGGQAMASQQIGSAVTNLTQRYEQLIRIPDNDPSTGGDLQVHCMSLVFRNWSDAYLKVLDRTDINPDEVGAPLKAFGKKWFSAEDNLKVAEHFRPGVAQVLLQVIGTIREEDNGPERLNPAKITLADVLDPVYFANLNICLDERFVERALRLAKPVDPSSFLPPGLLRNPHGNVVWERTANNGIKPVWKEPLQPVSGFVSNLMSVTSEMTYGEYLNWIQGR